MAWSAFWTALLTSIGGTGCLLVVIAFIGKKWLGSRIEEAVKHEYARKLEEHKAHLQEQVGRSVQAMQAEQREVVDQKAADKALFQQFLAVLPSNAVTGFTNSFETAGFSFRWDDLSQLRAFRLEWDDSEHEFLDAELERKRATLHEATDHYLSCIAKNTFSDDRGPFDYSIPYEWQDERPELFREATSALENLARIVEDAHSDLVRTARSKLKC